MVSKFCRLQLLALLSLLCSSICLYSKVDAAKKHGSWTPPRREDVPNSDIVLLSSSIPILLDYSKGVMAARNYVNRKCTIRHLEKDNVRDNTWKPKREKYYEHTYIVGKNITKQEVSRIAGITILNFCRGLKIHLIKTTTNKDNEWHGMVQQNVIPGERHQHKFDYHRKPKQEDLLLRRRRQATNNYERQPGKKRYRGQTQTQFIAFDKEGANGTDKGIAEAVAQPDLSRATVSGTNGMGQAQSQSGNENDCEECYPYGAGAGRYPIGPDGRVAIPGVGFPGQSGYIPGIVPGGGAIGQHPAHGGVSGTAGQTSGATVVPVLPGVTGQIPGAGV